MASFTGSSIKDVYKDILHTSNSNTGLSTTIKQITCGDGDATPLYLGTRNVKIQPVADSTANTVIYDADGNALVTVDSTNDLVKVGVGQHTVNTQYAHFGIGSGDSANAGIVAGRHSAIPFNGYASQTALDGSTGTDPLTAMTVTTTADDLVGSIWYLCDNITIDRVIWFAGGDAATGEVVRTHLMSYTIDVGNSATGGDLSSGAVLATSSDVTTAGYEQSYYNQMTIASADVDANKAIIFWFRPDSTVNSDYTINATVKYHLR